MRVVDAVQVVRPHVVPARLPTGRSPAPRPIPTHPARPPQLRAGNVLGDVLEGEQEGFDAIHVGAGEHCLLGMIGEW